MRWLGCDCFHPPPQAIVRGSERLDAFKMSMNWNQDELDQWSAAQRAKEEDSAAVESYRCGGRGRAGQLFATKTAAVAAGLAPKGMPCASGLQG